MQARNTLPEKFKKVHTLKSLLIRSGNKERTNTFILRLMHILKLAAKLKNKHHPLISITARYPLNVLEEKDPIKILDKCLYNLMPAFILRKTFVTGKLYNLPVPISPKRARFMSADWLRKAAFKDNKNALTVPYLLTREIGAVLYKTGSAYASLGEYIDTALDQRPFSRYIRRKRKNIARSKIGRAARKFRRTYRVRRRRAGKEKGHNRAIVRQRIKSQRRKLRVNSVRKTHIKKKKRFKLANYR